MSAPYPPGQPGGAQPGGGWIPVGAGAPPIVPVAAGGARRRGRPALTALGIVLVVAGLGGALALFFAGSKRYSDGIEKLARGPANCATTLDVAKEATYYFYVETKGELGDVRGSCPAIGDSFDVEGDGDARMSVQDEDGESVRLRRAGGVTYDSGGYSGELVRSARLDPGRYQLTVEADDDIAVAVGRDVDGLKTNLLLPIIVGLAGLVLGVAVLLLGRRGGTPVGPGGGAPFAANPGVSGAPFPGSSGLGQPFPGQPFPGQPSPGQAFPGQPGGPPNPPPAGWAGFQPPPGR